MPGAARRRCGDIVNVRVFLPNIADEDRSFLKNPAQRNDFWDPIKYIALRRENWFVPFS